MIYDVTVPTAPEYVNYVNSRDFSTELGGDNSPEGLAFLTLGSKPMLLAACEVSGTAAAYSLTAAGSSGTGNENGSGTDNGGNAGTESGGENSGNGTDAGTDAGGAGDKSQTPEIGKLGDEGSPASALAALAASAAALFGALLLRRRSSII